MPTKKLKKTKVKQKQRQTVKVTVNVNSNNKNKRVRSLPSIATQRPQIHINMPPPHIPSNTPPVHIANSTFMREAGIPPFASNTTPPQQPPRSTLVPPEGLPQPPPPNINLGDFFSHPQQPTPEQVEPDPIFGLGSREFTPIPSPRSIIGEFDRAMRPSLKEINDSGTQTTKPTVTDSSSQVNNENYVKRLKVKRMSTKPDYEDLGKDLLKPNPTDNPLFNSEATPIKAKSPMKKSGSAVLRLREAIAKRNEKEETARRKLMEDPKQLEEIALQILQAKKPQRSMPRIPTPLEPYNAQITQQINDIKNVTDRASYTSYQRKYGKQVGGNIKDFERWRNRQIEGLLNQSASTTQPKTRIQQLQSITESSPMKTRNQRQASIKVRRLMDSLKK